MIVSGVVLIVGGVLALLLPVAASLTATLVAGWVFIAAGILHIVAAFRSGEHRLWNGAFGVLGVLVGLSFLLNPLGGMISLTILIGAFFAASGIMQLSLAWVRRSADHVWLLALSGVISVALAVLIGLNVFAAAATVPGIVLAIELITTGFGFIALRNKAGALATKTDESAPGTSAHA
jgi:uncharacterized membrane protein HdeD (DUF308 family)